MSEAHISSHIGVTTYGGLFNVPLNNTRWSFAPSWIFYDAH